MKCNLITLIYRLDNPVYRIYLISYKSLFGFKQYPGVMHMYTEQHFNFKMQNNKLIVIIYSSFPLLFGLEIEHINQIYI